MFKVLLVLYLVGGGSTKNYDYTTGFNFQEFYSMEDCKSTIVKMNELQKVWHFGKDKEDIIPAHYSAECIEMTAISERTIVPPLEDTGELINPASTPPLIRRKQSRWND